MELDLTAAGSVKTQRLWPLMNISQLAAAGYLDAVRPIDFPVGWRQLYPRGKSLAYLLSLFSWPRFRMIQAWQVRAGYLTAANTKGAAQSMQSVCEVDKRCPAVRGQPYKGNISSTAQLTQSPVCWIITESRWLWKKEALRKVADGCGTVRVRALQLRGEERRILRRKIRLH